jgi:heterodisulfide reductase subunit A-like polyferredoxin
VNNSALIVGGGAAGMTSAITLAEQGFPVHLIERQSQLGGNLHHLRYFVSANGSTSERSEIDLSPREYLAETIYKVKNHPLIQVYLDTELVETGGFKGNFISRLKSDGQEHEVKHGAIIVATGGVEYRGSEYGYGSDSKIVTQQEFESLLADSDIAAADLNSVVMIQCVGPAERFCSRICCTVALKNALKLKELNPATDVTILYRDIRAYGFKERLYTQARRAGVNFIHYDFDDKPQVSTEPLQIGIREPMLDRHILLEPDLLVLSMPIIPAEGTRKLATLLKLPVDMDGFFLEAHVKLRPVDFSADGVFMAGLAHYPKLLDETIAQAQAAASRAATVLAQETMLTNARVAIVDPDKCVGCLTCVRICPYSVPRVTIEQAGIGDIMGAAYIEPAICHGCGTCVSECPARAIQLMHYTDSQTLTKVDALFGQDYLEPEFIPIEGIEIMGIG